MKNFLSNESLSIGNKYKLYLRNRLGNGSFGDIYKGINTTNNKKIAIKIEQIKKQNNLQLKNETEILSFLQGGFGIPKLYDYIRTSKFNFMIFELLGINLDQLFHLFNKKFTNNTTIALGLQMIERLEFIHSRHIIHRDIKPDNFLIGKGKNDSIVYICDFGLSKRFRDKKTGLHIQYKNGKHFIGTPIFASIYTHLGIEQSRRDDLESLAYILIYFSKGDLPWTKVKGKNRKEKYSKVLSLKININISDLCSELPKEYSKFLKYVRDLQFEEKPDYDYLKNLLKAMFVNENNVNLENFDCIDMLKKKSIYKNGSELYKRHIEEDIVNNYVSKKSIESNSKE